VSSPSLRRMAYRISAALGVAYGGYVLILKILQRPTGGPLGEVGEFLLVLACVIAFSVGLFADEAARRESGPSPHPKETP
jgi:hypothetical protein